MLVAEAVVKFLSRFATQLFAAMLMFAPVLKTRSYFPIRLALYTVIYSLFPYAIVGFDVSRLYGFKPFVFGWFNMNWIVTFIMCMIGFFATFKVGVMDTLFYGTAAYAMQHTIRNAGTIVNNLFGVSSKDFGWYLIIFLVSVPLYVLFYFLFVRRIKKDDSIDIKNKYIIALSVATMSIVTVLGVYVMSGAERSYYTSKIYSIVCCLLLLALQFGLFVRSKEKRERDEIEKMLHDEQELRRVSKENIDIINIKCHDLKHQIAAIRAMNSHEQIEESLKDVEKAVLIYDNVAKTGNETLDLILTEKSLQCEKHGIKISYIVDAGRLDAVGDVDLYSLFGNALDNALESVMNVPDKEKRVISVNVKSGNGFLSIHVDNYVEKPPEFENGLPVTTKKNKAYHGYGLKSIRYIASKYGGHVTVGVDDNIFNLDVIIPLVG